VSEASIYQWTDTYRNAGIEGLERKKRRGDSKLRPELYQFVRDELLKKNMTLEEVRRRAIEHAHKKLKVTADVPDNDICSIDQVRYVDQQLCDGVKTYGREGREKYRSKQELVGHFEADYPNHIWQVDHSKLDILVIDPATGEAKRPWLTLVLDDHCRAVMGYHLSFEANSRTISLAMRQAMLPKPDIPKWIMHGTPTILYTDNGKDYLSHHLVEVCRHFKIELKPHEPHRPQSKGKIERFFGTIKNMLIRFLDGYTGGSTKERPPNVTAALTLDELDEKLLDFFVNKYHERSHRSMKTTPRLRWQESNHTIRTIDTNEEGALDYLLEQDTRTGQNDGIQFKNGCYIDEQGLLQNCIGRQATIFYDRHDIAEIVVRFKHPDGKERRCVAKRNPGAREVADISARNRSQDQQEVQKSRRRSRRANADTTSQQKQGSSDSTQQNTSNSQPSTSQPRDSKYILYDFEVEDDV
jgi:putative transposase